MNRNLKRTVVYSVIAALITFGMVPTASALIDPLSLSVIGLGAMIVAITASEAQQTDVDEDQVASVPETVQSTLSGSGADTPQPN
jgi:hypothetical protein